MDSTVCKFKKLLGKVMNKPEFNPLYIRQLITVLVFLPVIRVSSEIYLKVGCPIFKYKTSGTDWVLKIILSVLLNRFSWNYVNKPFSHIINKRTERFL